VLCNNYLSPDSAHLSVACCGSGPSNKCKGFNISKIIGRKKVAQFFWTRSVVLVVRSAFLEISILQGFLTARLFQHILPIFLTICWGYWPIWAASSHSTTTVIMTYSVIACVPLALPFARVGLLCYARTRLKTLSILCKPVRNSC